MDKASIDILMITFNRPQYTHLSLGRLLETCDDNMRVWIWHNGQDSKTLNIVRSFTNHPRVHEFRHSRTNRKLHEPTNWFWAHAKGQFLSKVDDDCLMPYGWADTLRCAHADVPEFGVIGCWRFPQEDFVPESANKKINQFNGKHKLMQNCWVEGSGYLMKRQCLEVNGLLKPEQSFTDYCVKLAAKEWVNGWYYPFLYQEHMDDPRSPNTLLKSDDDFKRYMPLTAINFGLNNREQWLQFLRKDALKSQTATCNPKYYSPLRAKVRRAFKKLEKMILE